MMDIIDEKPIKEEFDLNLIKIEESDLPSDFGPLPFTPETVKTERNSDDSTNELLAEHFAFKWTPDGFKCPKCPFKTRIEGCLLNHIERKHPELHFKREKIFKCAHCSYQTEYKAHFAQHVLKKHTTSWYECEYCSYKSKKEDDLQSHIRDSHTDTQSQTFSCHKCDYKGKSKFLLKSHISNKHKNDIKWLACEQCEFTTRSKRFLRHHVAEEHEDSVDLKYKWLNCSFCDYRSLKTTEYRRHMRSEHSLKEADIEYKCPEPDCDFRSKYRAGISRHTFYKHTSFEEVKWLECEKCPYKAKSEIFLKAHMINEHRQLEEEIN